MDRIDDVLHGQWSWIDAHPDFKAVLPVAAMLYRLPAENRPLTVQEIAAATGAPEHAAVDALTRYLGAAVTADGAIDTDPSGRLPHFQVHMLDTGHRADVHGCAIDALMLPAQTGRPAQIDGTCPATGQPVTIVTGPDTMGGTATANPPNAVVTIMTTGDVGDIRGSICAPGQIFTSEPAARTWPELPPSAAIVSAADAMRFATRLAAALTNRT
jgi:hypothetical protein